MKTIGYAIAALLVGLGMQSPAFAAQHTGAAPADAMKQGGGTERERSDKRKQKNAEASYREARKACLSKQAEQEASCLRKAKAARDRAAKSSTQGAGPAARPTQPSSPKAVQTQSAEVGATGVAPPAVDRRTPGRPASSTR